MFKVTRKSDYDIIHPGGFIERPAKLIVYDVQYKNGYPFFTFYEDGQWITKSAKHYRPTM